MIFVVARAPDGAIGALESDQDVMPRGAVDRVVGRGADQRIGDRRVVDPHIGAAGIEQEKARVRADDQFVADRRIEGEGVAWQGTDCTTLQVAVEIWTMARVLPSTA